MRMSAPRPHTGGPARTLDAAVYELERDRLRALPPSAERTADLRRVTSALRSIANRSPRNGA